jgi:hypothetical protein
MRAVLMASAQAHPIIDGGRRFPNFNDGVDDRMGVGAPNGKRAQAIMDAQSYRYQRATPQQLGLQASFIVPPQQWVRVVLAWDQCPDYSTNDPDLKVDLDLAVRIPRAVFKLRYGIAAMYEPAVRVCCGNSRQGVLDR